MIQFTVIQLDNYGPWTEEQGYDREGFLQILQSSIYTEIQNFFYERDGLAFFGRFDNMFAISNGISLEEHSLLQKQIEEEFPITISMGIGIANDPFTAQKLASQAIQKGGSAQSPARKNILNKIVDNGVDNTYKVEIAHVDVVDITSVLTDKISAYNVFKEMQFAFHCLSDMFFPTKSLTFFSGGDNFVVISNGLRRKDFEEILGKIQSSRGLKYRASIGIGENAREAMARANFGLSLMRENLIDDYILFVEKISDDFKGVHEDRIV